MLHGECPVRAVHERCVWTSARLHAVSVDQTLQSPGRGKADGGDGGGAGAVTRAQRVLQRSDAGEWVAQGAQVQVQAAGALRRAGKVSAQGGTAAFACLL